MSGATRKPVPNQVPETFWKSTPLVSILHTQRVRCQPRSRNTAGRKFGVRTTRSGMVWLPPLALAGTLPVPSSEPALAVDLLRCRITAVAAELVPHRLDVGNGIAGDAGTEVRRAADLGRGVECVDPLFFAAALTVSAPPSTIPSQPGGASTGRCRCSATRRPCWTSVPLLRMICNKAAAFV